MILNKGNKTLRNSLFKIIVFVLLISFKGVNAQKTQKDSIQVYFKKIEELMISSNYNIKSLDTFLIKKTKDNSVEKANMLLHLCTLNLYNSADKASIYNNEALSLSKELGYRNGELKAKYNKAYLFFVNGLFIESINLAKEVLTEIDYTTYPEIYSDIKCLISVIYTEKGLYDRALEVALKLLDAAELNNNDYALMRSHGALEHYYIRISHFKKALHHCLKGLDYTIKLKKTQFLYFKIDETARMLAKLGDVDGALKAYNFFIKLDKKVPAGNYIESAVYMNISDIFIKNKELSKAQSYLSRAIEMNLKNDYRFRIPRAYILQAELHLTNKDTINAISFYEESLKSAEQIDAFDVIKSNSLILSKLNKKINPIKASKYNKLYKAVNDSIFNKEREQKVVILEAGRLIKEITDKKEILELRSQAQKAKISTAIIVLILILTILTFIIIAYFKVKNRNKFLFQKTLELAESQIAIRKQLNELQEAKTTLNLDEKNLLTDKESIDTDIKDIILFKLEKLENENFFIASDCCLRDLAKQLKTNPKYLSQVINQEKKSNFSNYINDLRINYLLPKLLKDEDFRSNKLTYISRSVGFNNLNTFNAAFKKRNGILPSYFINELIQKSKNN